MAPNAEFDPESLLPLPSAAFHILVALAEGDRHGYAIMQDVAARTDGTLKLSPGTLYRSVERMLEHALESRTILAMRPVIDHQALNTGLSRKREAGRIGPIGDDERDLGRIVRRLRGLDQRSHVGAAAGEEHGDALSRHRVTR